ncbi:hypothetical protein KW477_17470 [Vibrio fluvialis]|nr:hypothetical protein [Vibrio fluvialis]
MLSYKIKSLLDKLIATNLSKGVQPSDIADTMFEEHYVDLSIKKDLDVLIMTYSFKELNEDNQCMIISMRYTYSRDMFLQTVEQKVSNGRYKIQWDRASDLKAITDELKLAAKAEGKLDQVLKNLPTEVQAIVKTPLAA